MTIKFQKLLLMILFTLVYFSVLGQENDSILSRLHGISNEKFEFYNLDGYEISSLIKRGKFTTKNIRKKYKKLKIKEEELTISDTTIKLPNYVVHKSENIIDDIFLNSSYYFIETKENEISAVTFNSYNDLDIEFQRKFVLLIINKSIPKSIFSPITTDSVNFGGRTITLGGNCRWMNINSIQCSGYGQINWSVCKNMEIAERMIYTHRKVMEFQNNGKVISEELVDIVFEGVETKATKLIWDFTGVASVLVGMTGGKTLTIYFVTAPVRGNYISCVMSFWNNDRINPSGLAPLLEEVMKLN